jgi:hypothetical protein
VTLLAMNIIKPGKDPSQRVSDDIPLTLQTLFRRLGLKDKFSIHPVCYRCHRVYPPQIPANTLCLECQIPLYKIINNQGEDLHKSKPRNAVPHLQAPIRLLSSHLEELLLRDGMEEELEAWRQQPSFDGHLRRIQDGRVWKEIKMENEELFFANPCPVEELRIGVAMSLDW